MRFNQRTAMEGEVEVDLKDRKILLCLSENARMPYTKIAKSVGLSKDAVKYRINKLEQSGVIQGYVTVVDVSKLGYENYHLFMQLNQMNERIKQRVINIFKAYPFTRVVVEFSGKYDFEVGIVSKGIDDLDSRVTQMIEDVSDYLKDQQVLIISKSYVSRTFPKNFHPQKKEIKARKKHSELKMDDTDIKILSMLSKDATVPLHDVGKVVKLSTDAVMYRIRKMTESGLILKNVPIINYSALGYTTYAVLMNIHNLSEERERSLESFLKGNENILWAMKTIGKYNILMYVSVKKSDELHQTIVKMRELFSSAIKDYETLIAYEEYRYTYFPELCIKPI